jgi:regulator of sirC expression with transglutaminase-like and TPR domain
MNRHPFDLLMELPTHQIRLDCAALHLARDAYPSLSMSRYLRELDELAEQVAALRPGLAATLRFEALRQVIVHERGITGNQHDYYDPDNSYLNRVLDTCRGIPITLAVIWIEVGRRLKWPVSGVGLPGHVVVRIDDPERMVIADPFHGGRSLAIEDCRRIVHDGFDGKVVFAPEMLEPIDTRGIILRVLRNLRSIYLGQNDLPRVARALRRLVAADPQNGRHLQELAAVCYRRGDVRGACEHLALYLHRLPKGRDSRLVRQNLQQLRAALLALN